MALLPTVTIHVTNVVTLIMIALTLSMIVVTVFIFWMTLLMIRMTVGDSANGVW